MFGEKKFFSKNKPACLYCKRGNLTSTGESVLCYYKGVCRPEDSCRKFIYDPLRRKPMPAQVLPEFTSEDFEL